MGLLIYLRPEDLLSLCNELIDKNFMKEEVPPRK